jgi:hypothetical protein
MLFKTCIILTFFSELLTAHTLGKTNSTVDPSSIMLDKGLVSVREQQSGCDQHLCPDHNAAVDLFSWSKVYWFVRVNDCGACDSIMTDEDGCVSIKSCGREQNICVDYKRLRMHRIYKDNNAKDCFRMENTDNGGDHTCGIGPGNVATRPWSWSSREKIPCNW